MKNEENLVHFGFTFEKGGVHLARTMMLKELGILLDYVDSSEASKEEYISAIINDNCLVKRSVATRKLTARQQLNHWLRTSILPGRRLDISKAGLKKYGRKLPYTRRCLNGFIVGRP